jgi:hypothetical protein
MSTASLLGSLLLASILFNSFAQEIKPDNYVFIGEAIHIEDIIPEKNSIQLNYGVRVTYKVIKNLSRNFSKDTIEIEAYFHCGARLFTRNKHVLLAAIPEGNKFYLLRSHYLDVYKTTDKKWASPGVPLKFNSFGKSSLKPYPLKFVDSVWYDIRQPDNGCMKKVNFPEPYFKTEGNKAIALMGLYVEDIYPLKK